MDHLRSLSISERQRIDRLALMWPSIFLLKFLAVCIRNCYPIWGLGWVRRKFITIFSWSIDFHIAVNLYLTPALESNWFIFHVYVSQFSHYSSSSSTVLSFNLHGAYNFKLGDIFVPLLWICFHRKFIIFMKKKKHLIIFSIRVLPRPW